MSDQVVLTSRDGGVMRVRLNRPGSRNAVNMPICQELLSIFEELRLQPGDVRVVLVDGEGPCFCAGADLKERHDKSADWVLRRRVTAFNAYAALERCPVPVIALVHGPVVGSGAEIAMACDFAVAADDAYFRFPEPLWGTVGATQRLQRVIGKRRAKELLYTGRAMPSAEALALGLVARVVPAGSLQSAGSELAARISEAPALAIKLTKQAIDFGEEVDLQTGIRFELSAIEQNLAANEWQAGIERFSKSAVEPSRE